jgi:hypothetical protein
VTNGKQQPAPGGPLDQALRAYTRAALEVADAAIPEGPPQVLTGIASWVRADAQTFVLRDREDPYWVFSIYRIGDQLGALSEREAALQALRDDPVTRPLLNVLVGTAMGAHRVEESQLLDRLLYDVARRNGRLTFNDEAFDEAFADFSADVAATTYRYVVVAPLVGLSLASAPVPLAPAVELDKLTDDEISRCLRAGQLRSPFGADNTAWVREVAGVRVEYELPRHLGDAWDDEGVVAEGQRIQAASVERIQRVVEALRLFQAGGVYAPGYVSFTQHWPMQGGTLFAPLAPLLPSWSETYPLDVERTAEFASFYDGFERARANRIIASATRRFALAGERQRPDDKLVDLMIAAESLFLTDVGTAQDRGELRFRIALRAAFYIEGSGLTRQEIFRQIRRGYDARSAIVHGGELGDNLLRSPSGEAISVDEFALSIETLMRLALRRAIDGHEEGTSAIAAWDDLIFSEPSAG